MPKHNLVTVARTRRQQEDDSEWKILTEVETGF